MMMRMMMIELLVTSHQAADLIQPSSLNSLFPHSMLKTGHEVSVHHLPSQHRTWCFCIIHKPNTIPTRSVILNSKFYHSKQDNNLQLYEKIWATVTFYAETEQVQDNKLTEQKLDRSCARLQTPSIKSMALFAQQALCLHLQHKTQYNCCMSICIRQGSSHTLWHR